MTTPVTEFFKNGNRTVKLNSYVAVLCQKGGDIVMAVRMGYYQNKEDVYKVIAEQYPDWNMKAVHKLYDEDFEP